MKRHALALTAAVALFCSALPASAGSLDPALQSAAVAADAQDGVGVHLGVNALVVVGKERADVVADVVGRKGNLTRRRGRAACQTFLWP